MGCFLGIVVLATVLSYAVGREVGLSVIRQQGLAPWFEAFGTIAAVALALFQGLLFQWISRPKLLFSVSPGPPDCMMLLSQEQVSMPGGIVSEIVPVYYLRLRVKNRGKRKAQDVQVKLDEVREKQVDGSYACIADFPPMNLSWANGNRPVLPVIYPHTDEHCNLAHILRPSDRLRLDEQRLERKTWEGVGPNRTILSVDTLPKSYSLPHLQPAGSYRLYVTASSADTVPTKGVVEIDLEGQWYDDAEDMRSRGVAVRLLPGPPRQQSN